MMLMSQVLDSSSVVDLASILAYEPETLPLRLVERDGLLILEALVPVPPITDEMVEETREMLHRGRAMSR
jgi:hypothetical protein